MSDVMKIFVGSIALFLFLAYAAPETFVAIGKFLDAPRCAIGMTLYCDRNYDHILNTGD